MQFFKYMNFFRSGFQFANDVHIYMSTSFWHSFLFIYALECASFASYLDIKVMKLL